MLVTLVLIALFVAGVGMYAYGHHRRNSAKSEDVFGTPYMFYASLGGYSLPPEGFSVDSIPRSQMPKRAAESVDRLDFFLNLVSD